MSKSIKSKPSLQNASRLSEKPSNWIPSKGLLTQDLVLPQPLLPDAFCTPIPAT